MNISFQTRLIIFSATWNLMKNKLLASKEVLRLLDVFVITVRNVVFIRVCHTVHSGGVWQTPPLGRHPTGRHPPPPVTTTAANGTPLLECILVNCTSYSSYEWFLLRRSPMFWFTLSNVQSKPDFYLWNSHTHEHKISILSEIKHSFSKNLFSYYRSVLATPETLLKRSKFLPLL